MISIGVSGTQLKRHILSLRTFEATFGVSLFDHSGVACRGIRLFVLMCRHWREMGGRGRWY